MTFHREGGGCLCRACEPDFQPDPAQLTDEQIEELIVAARSAHVVGRPFDLEAQLADAAEGLLARLAAAENVVEAARGIAQGYNVYAELEAALAAYDAMKEPTGTRAESSPTEGDTHA